MDNSQVDQINKDLERGDKTSARNRLRELLLLEPENEALWLLYARAARTREQAIYCLERVLRLNPENRTAQTWMSNLEKPDGERPAGWTWECDSQGRYLTCSEDVQTWLGIPPQDFTGKPLSSYRLIARSRREVASILQAEAESAELNVTYILRNGDNLRGKLKVHLSVDEQGRILGWRGSTEVIEKKQAAEKVENGSKEARQKAEVTEPTRLCPFLGFVGDPQTCYTYPHPANSCLRQAFPTSVKTTYQAAYCLTKEYVDCPIFKGNSQNDKVEEPAGAKKRWKPRFRSGK